MTMDDVLELSIPQLEDLIEGIAKNNEKTQQAYEGNESMGTAQDLLNYLDANGGEI